MNVPISVHRERGEGPTPGEPRLRGRCANGLLRNMLGGEWVVASVCARILL